MDSNKVPVCTICMKQLLWHRTENTALQNRTLPKNVTKKPSAEYGVIHKNFCIRYRSKTFKNVGNIFQNSFLEWLRLLHLHSAFLRFLVFFLFIQVGSTLPKLCSDPVPIDLLARSLSNEGGLPTGVEIVKDDDNVKGYRFDVSARLLGVDTEQLFPLCNRFPAEFSILLTFLHHPYVRNNQYIMTLLAQDRHTVLLALRLQRNHLFLDYTSTATNEKNSIGFQSSSLSNGHWHTVVVTVTSHHVTFTLDCGTSEKKKLESDFPKKINIKRTKIYVASRRKKRKRFTGLLRQLILLPGADAAKQVCPSTNPSLASLDTSSPDSQSQAAPGVIFEEDFTQESCSSQSRGTLMYTDQMTMKVCDGDRFKPVRGGPKRMDYVVDYEDIITNNFTVSIQTFSIPGEGLFLATANNDDLKKNLSLIFKWDGKTFVRYQEIKTQSAIVWKFFQIDFEYYLMVANTGGLGVANITSTIYRWSSRRKLFEPYQAIGTYQVRSIEEFEAEGNHFLFVANHRRPNEINPQQLGPSILYIWDTNLREFCFYQWFTTHDALDVTFFKIALNPSLTYSCLVIANAYDGKTSRVTSEIFCLSRSYFVSRQMIPTVGAADWEFFQFEDRYFLVVANSFDKVLGSNPVRVLNSSIYELNVQYQAFLLYQEIETYGANDWEFFTIGNQYFLIVSNTVSSTSEIYRWQGIEKFVKVHSLPVGPCSDFDHILLNNEDYLAFANYNGILSKLYKIITY